MPVVRVGVGGQDASVEDIYVFCTALKQYRELIVVRGVVESLNASVDAASRRASVTPPRRQSGLVTARRPSDADVGRNADRLVATGGLVGVLDRGREGAAVVVADARVVARVRGVDQRVTRATVTRYRRQWQGVGVERRAVLSLEVQVRRPAVAATAADRDGLAGDHRT